MESEYWPHLALVTSALNFALIAVFLPWVLLSKKDSTSTSSSKYSVEYTIDINVHAVQDDMPAGMAKILGILTEAIAANDQGPAAQPQQQQQPAAA